MSAAALALLLLSALVVAPAFATLGAQAACPNPVIGLESCPPGSTVPVYPCVCYAHVDVTCELLA